VLLLLLHWKEEDCRWGKKTFYCREKSLNQTQKRIKRCHREPKKEMTDKDIEKAAGKHGATKNEKDFLQDQMKHNRDADL